MCGALLINLIEDLFRMLVGLNPVQSGIQSGADITTLIINNRGVRQIFTNLVAFATIMLIFLTIIKIIQEHYKDGKHGGNPYVIVFRMVKAMVLFMFVTAACVVGLQLSSVILRALDRATGYDPDGGIGGTIFVAMGATGNRVSQAVEALEQKQPDMIDNVNLYVAATATNREKGWQWVTDPSGIPLFYGGNPNDPYGGEVKYPDSCWHFWNPWCRCTPEVSPSYAEELSATGTILQNRYRLDLDDTQADGGVQYTGGVDPDSFSNPDEVRKAVTISYYIVRFDVIDLAAGAFAPTAYPDENGQAGYANRHGGYGAVRDLYLYSTWHTCEEVFQRNLPIYILDPQGNIKRAARNWNNKNTKNEHKGFARLSRARTPETIGGAFNPNTHVNVDGVVYDFKDDFDVTAVCEGDLPTEDERLFYQEANWTLKKTLGFKTKNNKYWVSLGAGEENHEGNKVNAGPNGSYTGLESPDDASSKNLVDEARRKGLGQYHYYAITMDKYDRPVAKDLRSYGILGGMYFYLTDHNKIPLQAGTDRHMTMFRYYYNNVVSAPNGALVDPRAPTTDYPAGDRRTFSDVFPANNPDGLRNRENYANWIDNMFKRRRNVTEYVRLYDDTARIKDFGYGQMRYMNYRAVAAMYDVMAFNWIIGFGGLFIALGVYNSFAFGMIQRIAELGILYMFSPVTLAFFPFDDGAQFNNAFVKPFYKKAISSFAPVLSLNIFFVILPAFDSIRWFQNGLYNTVARCLVSIAVIAAYLHHRRHGGSVSFPKTLKRRASRRCVPKNAGKMPAYLVNLEV